jgi:hypothetical protein
MKMRAERAAGLLLVGVVLIALLAVSAPAAPRNAPAAAGGNDMPAGMQAYPSPYYVIYSDLEPERVQEAILRMTRMAEEYHDRTKEFSGVIRQKFPFYLFKRGEDYYAAGGMAGSAGVFMVRGDEAKLMAIAGERNSSSTWHVIQHEGFHQFAHAVIGGNLPAWLNEGLAEYFGEGIFTGDGMITGVVPPSRLKRIQDGIRNRRFKSIQSMMLLSGERWNAEMDGTNYDMAWSMVHFLAHGEGGKYQGPFSQFVKDIGRHVPWDRAWLANFGSAEGFEKKWGDWWLAQEPLGTKDLYVKAVISTMASFVGRAALLKQTFDNVDELGKAARDGSLKIPSGDAWLPPTLITSILELKDKLGDDVKYEIRKDAKGPQVVANMADGTRVVATFVRQGPKRVVTSVDDLAPAMAKARGLLEEKKKAEARALLQEAIKRNPTSPQVTEARKLLATML